MNTKIPMCALYTYENKPLNTYDTNSYTKRAQSYELL